MTVGRTRYRWDPKLCKMVQIPIGPVSFGTLIMPDLPAYVSPVTGKLIDGRRQRREDLARTNSRPYEGREQETKERDRHNAYTEQWLDKRAEAAAHDTWAHSPERVRRALRGG